MNLKDAGGKTFSFEKTLALRAVQILQRIIGRTEGLRIRGNWSGVTIVRSELNLKLGSCMKYSCIYVYMYVTKSFDVQRAG